MNEDILFDNIYIGHSVEDAAAFRKETFDVKKPREEEVEKAENPAAAKKDDPKSPMDLVFMDDPVLYIKEKTALFIEIAQRSPIDAVKFVPEVAGAIGIGLLTLIVLLFSGGSAAAQNAPSQAEVKAKAQQAKDQAQKTKDQVADAVASGAESAKEEVNKRTTRSSAQ